MTTIIRQENFEKPGGRWSELKADQLLLLSFVRKTFKDIPHNVEFKIMEDKESRSTGIQISIPWKNFRGAVKFKNGELSLESLQNKYEEVKAEALKIQEKRKEDNKKEEQLEQDKIDFNKKLNKIFFNKENENHFHHSDFFFNFRNKELSFRCKDEETMMKLIMLYKENFEV